MIKVRTYISSDGGFYIKTFNEAKKYSEFKNYDQMSNYDYIIIFDNGIQEKKFKNNNINKYEYQISVNEGVTIPEHIYFFKNEEDFALAILNVS